MQPGTPPPAIVLSIEAVCHLLYLVGDRQTWCGVNGSRRAAFRPVIGGELQAGPQLAVLIGWQRAQSG